MADWFAWHHPYDDPASFLSRRLACVQRAITAWLDEAPAGTLRVISACAGQGRDLIGALEGHPRAPDVRALLVEADPRNVAVARQLAAAAGLAAQVTVVEGDASVTDAYADPRHDVLPADLVLMCGVFGNVPDDDIARTVSLLPTLCAPGAAVVYTRHRRPPDANPAIRRWFAEAGFEERSYDAPDAPGASGGPGASDGPTARAAVFAVGAYRLAAPPAPFRAGERLFTFVGDGHEPA